MPSAPGAGGLDEVESLRAQLSLVRAQQGFEGGLNKGVDTSVFTSLGPQPRDIGGGQQHAGIQDELQSLRALGKHLRSYPDKLKDEGVQVLLQAFLSADAFRSSLCHPSLCNPTRV